MSQCPSLIIAWSTECYNLLYDHLRMQDQEDDQGVDMTNDKNIVTGI